MTTTKGGNRSDQRVIESQGRHLDKKGPTLNSGHDPDLIAGSVSDILVPGSRVEAVSYQEELERTREQLMVFAEEISVLFLRERKQSQRLETILNRLRTTYLSVVQTLASVVEARDEYTRYHLERCKEYATMLAHAIDPALASDDVQHGFLLHDVGKIHVPDAIVTKPGPLSTEEMRVMRTHPIWGVRIVEPIDFLSQEAIGVIRHHHERFDGKGYPDGLEGDAIPLPARIFAVADAFDAMTTDRPYRKALGIDVALGRIRDSAGTQFDPEVVDVFLEIIRDRRKAVRGMTGPISAA